MKRQHLLRLGEVDHKIVIAEDVIGKKKDIDEENEAEDLNRKPLVIAESRSRPGSALEGMRWFWNILARRGGKW